MPFQIDPAFWNWKFEETQSDMTIFLWEKVEIKQKHQWKTQNLEATATAAVSWVSDWSTQEDKLMMTL